MINARVSIRQLKDFIAQNLNIGKTKPTNKLTRESLYVENH